MSAHSKEKRSPGQHHTQFTFMRNRVKQIVQSFDLSIPQQKTLHDRYVTQLYLFLINNQSRTQGVLQFVFKHNFWYNQNAGKTWIGDKIRNKKPFNKFLKNYRRKNKGLNDIKIIRKLNEQRMLMHQLNDLGQDIFDSIDTYVTENNRIKGDERKEEVKISMRKFFLDLLRKPETQMVLPNYFPLPETNNKPSKFSKRLYEFKQEMSTSESAPNILDNSDSFFGLINPNNSQSTSLEYQLPNFRSNGVYQRFGISGNNREEDDLFMQDQEQNQQVQPYMDSSFNLDALDEWFGPKFPQLTKHLSNIWKPQIEKDQKLFAMDVQPQEKVNQTPLNNTNFNNLSHDNNNNINMDCQSIESIDNDEIGNFLDQLMFWQREF